MNLQDDSSLSCSIVHTPSKLILDIRLNQYPLVLRLPFETSHSVSAKRINALLCFTLIDPQTKKEYIGYGEIGLPPKKRGCYEGDYADINVFMGSYIKELENMCQSFPDLTQIDSKTIFNSNNSNFFSSCREVLVTKTCLPSLFLGLALHTLDIAVANAGNASSVTSRCGVELALFDIWGKVLNKNVSALLGKNTYDENKQNNNVADCLQKNHLRSFYTAGLNPDIQKMLDSAKFGMEHTPLLKIKLDDDVQKGATILSRMHAFMEKEMKGKSFAWSIDANASWSPEIAMEFLKILKPYAKSKVLFMVEQPFPLWKGKKDGSAVKISEDGDLILDVSFLGSSDISPTIDKTKEKAWLEFKAWKNVKEAYEEAGILIYGDESVSCAYDIQVLHPLMHGVNIKLEKTGGFRNAMHTIQTAKDYNMHVWIGIMVGSILACTAAAQLLPYAYCTVGDVDGSLLVEEDSQLFDGGITWAEEGEIILPSEKPGFGLTLQKKYQKH